MKSRFGFIALAILSMGLTSCGTLYETYKDGDKYLVGNQTYQEEINVLDIDWVSGTITLIEDETIQGIKVEEDTDTGVDNERVHSYLNNGELKVKYFASGYHRVGSKPLKKELTVTYKPGLGKIVVDLTSGTLNADNLTADKFVLDMTSGRANIGTLTAQSVDTDITSGTIVVNKMSAKELESDLTSGTIEVGFDYIEKADFDLTSGNIKMTLPEDGGKVSVSKTSGSVNTYRECTVSGNTYVFGTGAADIKVSMTSGKLSIY